MGVATDVVDIEQVDTREAEALQAVLVAAQDAVVRIIVAHAERHRRPEAIALRIVGDARIGIHQPPDLGRDRDFRTLAQRIADATLGQAATIMRRGIDVAQPGIQCRIDRGACIGIGHRVVEIAERGRTEPQFGHGQSGAPHGAAGYIGHSVSPNL